MRKSERNTQRATAITLAAALVVAVYLNWEYAKTDTSLTSSIETSAEVVEVGISDALLTETEALEAADKTYGEAQLVSVSSDEDSFFDEARLNRTKTRDEVLEEITESLQDASLTAAEKEALTAELSANLTNITLENEIETLVKAKGIADCICFLETDKASLTVITSGEGLDAAQVAQIRDIVLSKCDVSAQNITIVEVK